MQVDVWFRRQQKGKLLEGGCKSGAVYPMHLSTT